VTSPTTSRTALPPAAVTGLGAVTPLGADVAELWSGLLEARSGANVLTEEWAEKVPVRIAAQVKVDPAEVLGRVTARTLDRVQQLALVAARQAWAHAGAPSVEPERLAVVVGTGIGGALTMLGQHDVVRDRGARRVSPHTVPMLMPNGPAAAVGLEVGARGGVHTPVSACASGSEALAMGLDLLRLDRADVVVVGGSEACIHPLPMAGFGQMRALSPREDPHAASRPFDKGRDGFVIGEGAGILVLERPESAAARGATVHGLLAGAGVTSDAHHVTAPDPEGSGAARAITKALRDAGLSPSDVVHVNAHATSTPVGDVAEAAALRRALGDAVDDVLVTSNKGSLGHLLGAAGAVEAIASLLSLQERVVPPTRNLDDPDDDVRLDVVTVSPRQLSRAGAAVSDSFGFGGHNVALAFLPA
jgi:3-oxoacyl-[acyl-carrier-protein] synthase II